VTLNVQEAGAEFTAAAASQVIPVVARLETVIVCALVTMTAMNSSAAVVVDNPVIVKVEPEDQVPVFLAFAFASIAGTAPMTTLV